MKSIVAFSDLHFSEVPNQLKEACTYADYVFFLGDGFFNVKEIGYADNFYGVKGNCDYTEFLEDEQVIQVEELRILITHGHKYGVKDDTMSLLNRAHELNCNVVFYGHTHCADIEQIEGVTLVNPGALYAPNGSRSYSYCVVNKNRFSAKIVELK